MNSANHLHDKASIPEATYRFSSGFLTKGSKPPSNKKQE